MNENLQSREADLITKKFPKSPVTETFRSIRTNLNFMSPDKSLETILITSSGSNEGKSLILSNLAVSLAQNRKEVVIIDADLRKPEQHYFFAKPNLKGLSDILTGDIELAEGLRETGMERVKLITAGPVPPNPAELLDSQKMEKILTEAKEYGDIVLVDAPPILVVTDPVLLSRKVDGVILVVASHQTHKSMLVKAKENLELADANMLGVILNKFPFRKGNSYYNSYYENYYAYYGEKESG